VQLWIIYVAIHYPEILDISLPGCGDWHYWSLHDRVGSGHELVHPRRSCGCWKHTVTGCGSLGTWTTASVASQPFLVGTNYAVGGFDMVLGILLDGIAAPDSHVSFDPISQLDGLKTKPYIARGVV
jgi:hypothetical protein